MEGLVSQKNYVHIVRGGGGSPKVYMCVQGEKSVVDLCTHCAKIKFKNECYHKGYSVKYLTKNEVFHKEFLQ